MYTHVLIIRGAEVLELKNVEKLTSISKPGDYLKINNRYYFREEPRLYMRLSSEVPKDILLKFSLYD